jgi:putative flippase GtrA
MRRVAPGEIASSAVSEVTARTARALRQPHNWIQLLKFGTVGVSGYFVNLAIYASLLGIGAHAAALISFVVSAVNNYWWSRHWTFASQKGHFGRQGLRFLVVALIVLAVSQLWLFVFLDWLGLGKIVAQALSIVLVTPISFLGNKLWSFRR